MYLAGLREARMFSYRSTAAIEYTNDACYLSYSQFLLHHQTPRDYEHLQSY